MKTKHLHPAFASTIWLVLLAACSSDPIPSRGAGTIEPATDAGAVEEPSSTSTTGPENDEGSKKDASAPEPEDEGDDPTKDLPTNADGCLTFAAAQQVCGFSSDGAICAHAVGCDATTSKSDCGINCEMQSTVTCLKPADAKCLLDAAAAKSCSALAKCKWKL